MGGLARRPLALSIAATLLAPASALAVPTFTGPTHFNAGANPAAVLLADVNGDVMLDVVTANSGSANGANGISVLPNTTTSDLGPETFGTAVGFGAGASPAAVAVGDFNGDFLPDLVVANGGSAAGANGVSVLLNTGAFGALAPSFSGPTHFGAGASPASVAVGDFNKDFKTDIVTANKGSASGTNGVSVLLNTTPDYAITPTFAGPTHFSAGANPAAVAVGEINRDFEATPYARPDIVVANSGSNDGTNGVSVLLNTTPDGTGTPSFSGPTNFTAGKNPTALALYDFNNDIPFKTDIATANSGSDDGSAGVSMLINTNTADGAATPSFSGPTNFTTGANPTAINAAANVDYGGVLPDIVTAHEGSASGTNGISILSNTTTGNSNPPTFTGPVNLDVGANPASVDSADLTGDGPIEIVTANSGSGSGTNGVSVLLYSLSPDGRTSPECTGGPGGTQTTWSSTRATIHTDRNPPHRQAYSTRVVARGPAGEIVFDETTPNPPESPQVSDLFASAQAALRQASGGGATVAGPSLESSSVTTGPELLAGSFLVNSNVSGGTSTSVAFGPASILVGLDHSVFMFIPSGCTNTDTHVHFATFADDVYHATDTNNATYSFAATAASAPGTPAGPGGLIVAGCLNADAALRGKALGPARLGRKQKAQRAIFKGARVTKRRGIDTYCATGGGTYRIGYPTKRLTKGLRRSLIRKIRKRVVLILTSSPRFTVAGIKPGATEAAARTSARGAVKVKVGKNNWYVKPKGATLLLVKAQGGKVGEVGIADKRLGRGKKGLKRLLRGWQIR